MYMEDFFPQIYGGLCDQIWHDPPNLPNMHPLKNPEKTRTHLFYLISWNIRHVYITERVNDKSIQFIPPPPPFIDMHLIYLKLEWKKKWLTYLFLFFNLRPNNKCKMRAQAWRGGGWFSKGMLRYISKKLVHRYTGKI